MSLNSTFWTSRAALIAALCCLTVVVGHVSAPQAHAQASKALTGSLISAAQQEFKRGNYARAGDLFLAIWQQDKSNKQLQLAAAYNAARSFQLAAKLERAEGLYRELQALPGLPKAVLAKCKKQLRLIQIRRAEDKAALAAKAERQGKPTLAVSLWADALALAPNRRDWTLRRARAQQLAGQRDEARAGYQAWLKGASPDDSDRSQAERWLAEVSKSPTPGATTESSEGQGSAAAKGPTGQQAKQKGAPHANVTSVGKGPARWPGWLLMAGSAGAAGVGAWLLLDAQTAQRALDDDLALMDNESGKIIGITKADADAEALRIERQYLQGWIAAGVGLAGAGVALYLLVRDGERAVTLSPTGQGAILTMHF